MVMKWVVSFLTLETGMPTLPEITRMWELSESSLWSRGTELEWGCCIQVKVSGRLSETSLFPCLSPEEHKVHIQTRAILLHIYSLFTQGKFQWELWKYVQKAFSKHIWPLQLASVFKYWDPIWAEDFIMAKICHWHCKAVVFTLSHSVTKHSKGDVSFSVVEQ